MKSFFENIANSGAICAHRGARSIAPENTWLAMEQARRCGADLWETDVQMTADGELVLFHDCSLQRTTDIEERTEFSSRTHNLTDFTAAELSPLDAGSWFLAADPFNTIATGEVAPQLFPKIEKQKIPLLRDVLKFCRDNNFPLNLEIKNQTGTAADGKIVTQIIDCLSETESEHLVLLSSFNHDYLRQVRKLNPALTVAALVEDAHPDNLLDYLKELGTNIYHPDQEITPADQVRELVAAGLQVNLWTVNDVAQAQDYIAAGATFICTDWPQKMVNITHS